MANILESYPVLNDNTIKNIFLGNSFIATYRINNHDKRLDIEEIDEGSFDYLIKCNDGEWNLDKYNLNISGTLRLQNINALFEGTTDRIADKDTVIGVSMSAYSRVSKINKIKQIGSFKYGDIDNLDFSYEINFDAKSLMDKMYIDFELFVESANKEVSIFSNKIGSKFGIINELIIELEGNGSIFPIVTFNDPKKPLWIMDINYDTFDDAFSSRTICLKINTAHKYYSVIGSEDITPNNSFMWKEILATFLENIILSIKGDYESLKNYGEYKEGSVGLFLQYLIDVFEIEASDLEHIPVLLSKIKSILDDKIKV